MKEQVPGGAAWSLVVHRGEQLRVTALGDDANVSLLVSPDLRPGERLSVPDTCKAQMQSRIRAPMVLISDLGRALMSMTGSSLSWHDCLTGHGTDTHLELYGPSSYAVDRNAWKQSARAGLLDELAKRGLGPRDLGPTVNLFTKVVAGDDDRGTLTYEPQARAGDWVALRAELDVLVVLSTSPHPLDPRTKWAPSAVELEISRVEPPGPDDASRTFRPESARALAETERTTR